MDTNQLCIKPAVYLIFRTLRTMTLTARRIDIYYDAINKNVKRIRLFNTRGFCSRQNVFHFEL